MGYAIGIVSTNGRLGAKSMSQFETFKYITCMYIGQSFKQLEFEQKAHVRSLARKGILTISNNLGKIDWQNHTSQYRCSDCPDCGATKTVGSLHNCGQ